MSKPRVTSDEQCRELAAWYEARMTIVSKAKQMGISVSALYDSIARGRNLPTAGMRYKLAHYDDAHADFDNEVPRESNQNVSNGLATDSTDEDKAA